MDILAVKNIDKIELIESVEKGFSYKIFERIVKEYNFAVQDLAGTIGISQRTLTRRKIEKKFSKSESDRLVSIARLLEQTSALFEQDKAKAKRWLNSSNRGLGGRTPLQMAQTETGLREVENLIGRLENGVFS